jgi:transposase-like protein
MRLPATSELPKSQRGSCFTESASRCRTGTFRKLSGEVEVDETYIGGKINNMHKDRKIQAKRYGRAGAAHNKMPVIGLRERNGQIIARTIKNTKRQAIQSAVYHHVERGASVYTDAHGSYTGLEDSFDHQVIDHAVAYVNGRIHTNGLENFWSLVKRGLKGTYVSVEPEHLNRYVTEQVFRYNQRKGNDGFRFEGVLEQVQGRRVTWKELTRKV